MSRTVECLGLPPLNEEAPTGEQPNPILGGTVLPTELPTPLIIQPNTTVNSFARSRHRAQQRWCALLKRICKSGVASRLASSQWDDFKQFAKAYYYDKFLAVLKPQDGLLECVGPIEGGQCPANMVVDFTDANVLAELECLHIDHTYDINLICRTWLDLLPQRPVSWHENIDVEVLCHELFSIVLCLLPARVSFLLRVSSSDAIPKNTNAMQLERHITTTCYGRATLQSELYLCR